MRKILVALGLILACAFALPAQAQYSKAAQDVLARARAASGGAGWNQLRGWREAGRQGDVRYELWLDPLRYGMRMETHEPAGFRVQGFNGAGYWQILPSGYPTGAADRATLARVRSDAFFRGAFFFFPGRYDARGQYLAERKSQGRAFDVLVVQPWAGTPRELWFDRRTRLLSRIVDRSGERPVTVELSDYRRVGPVLVAFRHTIDDGETSRVEVRQIESLAFTPADRGIFSLPRSAAPQAAASARLDE